METKRFGLLDSIRGVVLVSMAVYHAAWNFVYIYGVDWKWYKSPSSYVWQQSICWTFILLSGFCFSLGKRHWKNGIVISLAGGLVTAVTMLVMPENRIVFGVLTCIGACILTTACVERILKRVPVYSGCLACFLLFLFTKNINYGYLGFGELRLLELGGSRYGDYVATFLGVPFDGFWSTDYFSFFPWFFLFLTGFYLCRIFQKYEIMGQPFMKWKLPVFSALGRHSLCIYLLHQPVIYALQELYF